MQMVVQEALWRYYGCMQDELKQLVRDEYSPEELRTLLQYLTAHDTFTFTPLTSGLYPASPVGLENGRYRYAWVRDNVHSAHALFIAGRVDEAVTVVHALIRYFDAHAARFDACIEGRVDLSDPMERPHVRFDGDTLQEVSEVWPHAQNDAHGYFVWLISVLLRSSALVWDDTLAHVVRRTVLFLGAIRFFEDADSGHWEEGRAVRASSIGTVCAGLRTVRPALAEHAPELLPTVDALYEQGVAALARILPCEATGAREYDAATLFLVEPLGEVTGMDATRVVARVREQLMGAVGIARYPGDAFWGPDYDALPVSLRTANASTDDSFRRTYGVRGKGAQWCIFDPLLSAYFERTYRQTGDKEAKQLRFFHLNRSLRALVARDEGLYLPELYYEQNGIRTPNTIVPLYWAQANLLYALQTLLA